MSPRDIAHTARKRGLEMVALTDHNSALNTPAFAAACKKEGITGIYGMEVTTQEEAHILCLFESPDIAMEFGEFLYPLIPDISNDPDKMGDQVYVDADENILGEVEKWLVGAAALGLDSLLSEVHQRGGLYIPAHIDKPVYSIPSQLGFLPPMDYDALESVQLPSPLPGLPQDIPVIQNSDAHYIEDIGKRFTDYDLISADFSGLYHRFH